MKLWALCQRQRALSQKTLPVFVLILPIWCSVACPSPAQRYCQ